MCLHLLNLVHPIHQSACLGGQSRVPPGHSWGLGLQSALLSVQCPPPPAPLHPIHVHTHTDTHTHGYVENKTEYTFLSFHNVIASRAVSVLYDWFVECLLSRSENLGVWDEGDCRLLEWPVTSQHNGLCNFYTAYPVFFFFFFPSVLHKCCQGFYAVSNFLDLSCRR